MAVLSSRLRAQFNGLGIAISNRSRIRVGLLYLFLCLLAQPPFAAEEQQKDNISTELKPLSNELLAEVNFEHTELVDWLRAYSAESKKLLATDTRSRDVQLIVSLKRQGPPEFSLAARPAFDSLRQGELRAAIGRLSTPRPSFTDFHMQFNFSIAGGCGCDSQPFLPPVLPPEARIQQEFVRAPLEKKRAAIIQLAREEVLPTLVALAERSDSLHFATVRQFASTAGQWKAQAGTSAASITDSSSAYWRAMMELSSGNTLLSTIKVGMLLAEGKFDLANRYVFLLNIFTKRQSMAAVFLNQLSWRLHEFYNDLNTSIQRGIALHDTGRFAEAAGLYKKILAIHPQSAWANLELYYSQTALRQSRDSLALYEGPAWEKARSRVFACDPLYPLTAKATSGREAYLLTRRHEINSFFRSKETFAVDYVSYADIALDVGAYGLAAEIYWLGNSFVPREQSSNRNLLSYFVYCVFQLGDTDIIKLFNSDFGSIFASIEKDRRDRMQRSAIYQRFETRD